MQQNGLSQSDFYSPTGYGYGDTGREKTERIFRDVFCAEDALVDVYKRQALPFVRL